MCGIGNCSFRWYRWGDLNEVSWGRQVGRRAMGRSGGKNAKALEKCLKEKEEER